MKKISKVVIKRGRYWVQFEDGTREAYTEATPAIKEWLEQNPDTYVDPFNGCGGKHAVACAVSQEPTMKGEPPWQTKLLLQMQRSTQ